MTQNSQHLGSLMEALSFAAAKHRDQRRKGAGAAPYINHPIQVAELLATTGAVRDVPTLMAAVLHDTIEDTETTAEELVQRFGAEVANLVGEVTDDKSLKKEARKQAQIEHAPQLSPKATLIKIADKTCNVRDIGTHPPVGWSVQRCREYFLWAEAVVAGCRGSNAALEAAFDDAVAKSRAIIGGD